jgi:ectoine hydroxylase-related dioxygenase (phytanoyl-CoA dioxygenase family)
MLRGVIRKGISTMRHADRDYGHPTGEVNVWLPLNGRVWGGNSLWRDGDAWGGEGTSRPFEMEYGEAVLWYGNGIKHETRKNETDVTRVSFDFRVIPGSLFEKKGVCKTFDEGGNYFIRMDLKEEKDDDE